MNDRARFERTDKSARRLRKLRDIAFIIPLIGLVLLASPVMNALAGIWIPDNTGGAIGYVFVIWAGLIGAAFLLSRYLSDDRTRR